MTFLSFVTFGTRERRSLLANETGHGIFMIGLSLGAAVGRYVLMPDHIHVFVRLSLIFLSRNGSAI
jgi:hypothetical protein